MVPKAPFEMSPYSAYIHKSRYARWNPDKKRRENWDETVGRFVDFFAPRIPKADREAVAEEIRLAVLHMDVMPSMRSMSTAGPALEKDNAAGYNCSYIAVDDPRAFDEAMYLSMCGTGVGFSVERQYVNQLPTVAEVFYPVETCIKVRDSKIGWANAFRQLVSLLYTGSIPTWDMSAVRPAGAPLRTMGGRASGPEPLDRLFRFAVATFQKAAGRRLTSLEAHDIMCMVADIVVVGGVRRSAMLSLSNLSDERMRNAKTGQWWTDTGYRRLANNSVAYTEKPEPEIFIKEFLTLIESKSGERGIFNRVAATNSAKRTGRRKWEGVDFGTNPCGEINLRSKGFCNLSECVIRPGDTKATIKRKIRLAVIIDQRIWINRVHPDFAAALQQRPVQRILERPRRPVGNPHADLPVRAKIKIEFAVSLHTVRRPRPELRPRQILRHVENQALLFPVHQILGGPHGKIRRQPVRLVGGGIHIIGVPENPDGWNGSKPIQNRLRRRCRRELA